MDNIVQLLQCINLACLERRQHFFTPGRGKRVFPHWKRLKNLPASSLSLPRSRPRVHRGFYISNQPARAMWVLETLVSKQNWVLQFLSQKFNEARSWSRELGGLQPSHKIPHSLRRHGNHEMKDATIPWDFSTSHRNQQSENPQISKQNTGDRSCLRSKLRTYYTGSTVPTQD